VAANKDKARAILSYATPNPVGPYRLVTPPTPVGPSKTKTPILPVVGGSLINVPLPQMPSKTSNAPAQDVGQRKQINVPTPPMAEKLKAKPTIEQRILEQPNSFNVFGIRANHKDSDSVDRALYGKESPIAIHYTHLKDIASGANAREKRKYATQSLVNDLFYVKNIADIPSDLVSKAVDVIYNGRLQDETKRVELMSDHRSASYFYQRGYVPSSDFFKEIGNQTKGMSKVQKDTFLTLLPEWSGTMKELAQTARSLGG